MIVTMPLLLMLRNAFGWNETSPGIGVVLFNEKTDADDRNGSNPSNNAPPASAVVLKNDLLEVVTFP
jgi:hypothetical protein